MAIGGNSPPLDGNTYNMILLQSDLQILYCKNLILDSRMVL